MDHNEIMGQTYFRMLWQHYLEPVSDVDAFNAKLTKRVEQSLSTYYRDVANKIPLSSTRSVQDEGRLKSVAVDVLADLHSKSRKHSIDIESFNKLNTLLEENDFPEFMEIIDEVISVDPLIKKDPVARGVINAWQKWKSRVIKLTPKLIVSIREITEEYLVWLKRNPNALDRVHWEAFEKLIAEMLASQGFSVDIVSRVRNRSADLFAVRTDELGIETKYLIECKRYSPDHVIGMEIVNGVLGAAVRANVDHALLVTSSYFTKDVRMNEPKLLEFRLHLRDGNDVREWLRAYSVKPTGGLWVASG